MLKHKTIITATLLVIDLLVVGYVPTGALAIQSSGLNTVASTQYQCGSKSLAVPTAIDFGCYGDACVQNASTAYCSQSHSAIIDFVYAIIRFLTDGVGLVVIASLIIAGIQYITSSGNPDATRKAMARIQSSVIALLLFIFAYAILNYIIPAGFFQ